MNEILSTIQPANGKLIAEYVTYEIGKKTDPSSKDHDWLRITSSENTDYPVGMLVKYPNFQQEIEIDGVVRAILEPSQILLKIHPENVKENLLKKR